MYQNSSSGDNNSSGLTTSSGQTTSSAQTTSSVQTTTGQTTSPIPLVTSGCGPLTSDDLQIGQNSRIYTDEQEREIMRNALTSHGCINRR